MPIMTEKNSKICSYVHDAYEFMVKVIHYMFADSLHTIDTYGTFFFFFDLCLFGLTILLCYLDDRTNLPGIIKTILCFVYLEKFD